MLTVRAFRIFYPERRCERADVSPSVPLGRARPRNKPAATKPTRFP